MQDGIIRFGCWRQGISGWWREGAGGHRTPRFDREAACRALTEEERQRQRQARINDHLFAYVLNASQN
jgi:hypothetical protein